ncbi:hypothetical protein AF332_14170 [Sporosarcina globispora]|uniref:HTH deoR-type domain-containing protein n=1 Tax=Sporosarcina globispora TaxID=1459 RepID=A0A0M0GDC7_SPOGL|nr:DeoR/GlpR family DNA-binding transcription regulator [Sporosarcina globispora]KON87859.1 hypothetical protein AF332_14170 [Sporosarcina globispora]
MKIGFVEERHRRIMRELEMKNKVSVSDLSSKLNVTPETIRSDLRRLEERNKLRRIHGGAICYYGLMKEQQFNKKISISLPSKKKIGEAAASFISDGDTVVLDVGSTTIHIAGSIENTENVTIITNSLAAAEIINTRIENKLFNGKVILIGGTVDPLQRSTSGSITNQMLEQFYFDKAFISCGGMNPEGICDYNIDEAAASAIMVKRSKQVFVVADSSKLNQRAFFNISPFSAIDFVITDADMPTDWPKEEIKFNGLKWLKVHT